MIAGTGELHLEIIVAGLRCECNVEASVGRPQVAYKETLTRAADGEMEYATETGDRGQYGPVKVHVFFGAPGTGVVFENDSGGETIPDEFITAINEGIEEALMRGVLAGHPVDDVRIVCTTVRTTMSIRRRWRPGSPVRWRFRTLPGRGTFAMRLELYQLLRPGENSGGSRDSLVGAPLKPRPTRRDSRVALPEPEEDGLGE